MGMSIRGKIPAKYCPLCGTKMLVYANPSRYKCPNVKGDDAALVREKWNGETGAASSAVGPGRSKRKK